MPPVNINDIKNTVRDVAATTNNDIGIIENLFGKSGSDSFYDVFYNSFLTTANSLPINSLWMVFINGIPTAINTYVNSYEKWDVENTTKVAQTEAQRKKGIIIAQGVKLVGDSLDVTRDGIKNSGYVQGLIGQGRVGFPLLNIAFLENNISFTDYFLRPWQVAVSHESLKNQSLKEDITVWFLSRMGAKRNMAIRKAVVYRKCCPVNIDEQEYNYQGSDLYRLRQIQFAFSTYEMVDVDTTLLSLININGLKNNLFNSLKNELQRQFGANNPRQYINNLVDRAKEFGSQLVTGTATQIVTNVAGKVQDKVENAIQNIERDVRSRATDIVNSVNNYVDNALDNSSKNRLSTSSKLSKNISDSVASQVETQRRIGANNAAFGGYVQKNINKDDSPLYAKSIEVQQQGAPAEVNVTIPINQNDTPNTNGSIPFRVITKNISNPNDDTVMLNTKLKYDYKKDNPPMNDVRHGEINHENIVKKIPQNDYVSMLQVNNAGKTINQADIPDRKSITYTVKTIKQDDAPMHKNT